MKKLPLIVFLLLGLGLFAKAQELQCEVRVNSTQVSGSDRTIYQNLQTALYEFINNTKFTEINFRQAPSAVAIFSGDLAVDDMVMAMRFRYPEKRSIRTGP